MKPLPPPSPGGCHRHGRPDGPADHSGPVGRVVAARGGGLRRAGGPSGAPLPGHVQPSAYQRVAPAGEGAAPSGGGGGVKGQTFDPRACGTVSDDGPESAVPTRPGTRDPHGYRSVPRLPRRVT